MVQLFKERTALQQAEWCGGLGTLAAGLSVALGINAVLAEFRYIPSASMEPTIHIHDRVIVEKFTYRFHPPQRNDIVVFNPTHTLLRSHFNGVLIKRVIGLPGEQVQVKGGQVFVNQQPLRENFIAAKPNYIWGPQTIPANSYLVLGDNRNHSYDSHNWGFVQSDRIIGRAVFRYWPFNHVSWLSGHV